MVKLTDSSRGCKLNDTMNEMCRSAIKMFMWNFIAYFCVNCQMSSSSGCFDFTFPELDYWSESMELLNSHRIGAKIELSLTNLSHRNSIMAGL